MFGRKGALLGMAAADVSFCRGSSTNRDNGSVLEFEERVKGRVMIYMVGKMRRCAMLKSLKSS